MTTRLALAIYFALWLAWLVPRYIRRYHGGAAPPAETDSGPPKGRTLLYLIIWVTVIIAAATAWRVLHPGSD